MAIAGFEPTLKRVCPGTLLSEVPKWLGFLCTIRDISGSNLSSEETTL